MRRRDVIDAVALGEPLLAIMEGSEGDIAQLAIGGVDDVLDVGLFQVGFQGLDQPAVEFLSGGFGIAFWVLQGSAEVKNSLSRSTTH